MSIILVHICCWQPPSLTQRLRSSSSISPNCKHGGEQTTTELKKCPTIAMSKRRTKKSDKEKQCKKKELDQASDPCASGHAAVGVCCVDVFNARPSTCLSFFVQVLSTDAICKVCCKWVKWPRRSWKK